MSVTVSGWSGLTNAYRSALSATGSLLISGASRCDDMGALPYSGIGGLGEEAVQRRLTALRSFLARSGSVSVTLDPPENTSNVLFFASRREITGGSPPPAPAFSPARLSPATPAAEAPTPTVAAMARTRR